jgi:hypothetical protein
MDARKMREHRMNPVLPDSWRGEHREKSGKTLTQRSQKPRVHGEEEN